VVADPRQHPLRDDVDNSLVHLWIDPLVPLELTADRLVLGAPELVRQWVGDRYMALLNLAAAEVVGHPVEVTLVPMIGERNAA
jgi:hypothetical protein